MEELLKNLSNLQMKALHNGVSFDLDLYVNSKKIPSVEVKMSYSVAGDVTKGFAFSTTFEENTPQNIKTRKINSINHFISTVSEPIDSE